MKLLPAQPWYGEGNSQRIVTIAFIAIALIAMADVLIIPFIGFGYLYLVPLTIAAAFLARWQIVVIATICATFSESFSKLPEGNERYPRLVFMYVTYLFVTLLVRELARYRRAATRRIAELERDVSTFQRSEQELELLINSSAVGILTVSPDGKIATCNRAAHEIFSVDAGGLVGQPVAQFLPTALTGNGASPIACAGTAADGRSFSVRVWTSTFTSAGNRMTALMIEPS